MGRARLNTLITLFFLSDSQLTDDKLTPWAVNNVFNTSNLDVQVIFMVETHLSESSEIPGSIFKNMGMLNEFATNEDKAAGILCCYSLLLPYTKRYFSSLLVEIPSEKKEGYERQNNGIIILL